MAKSSNELFDLEVVEEPIEDLVVAEDLPEDVKRKYLNDIRYLREHGMNPGEYPGISSMQTSAYPNYDYVINRDKPADTRKWLEAARQIFYFVHNGEDRGKALDRVVGSWNKMEKNEFYYWLRFYEEGGHTKYKAGDVLLRGKIAQIGFFDGVKQPGYYMPMNQQQPASFDQVKSPTTHPDVQEDERREQIEEIRAKILSRLDSAEKLMRSQEAHMLASNELGALVDGIHQLKQKVLTINKRSLSTRLYEDLIVRQANMLTRQGFFKGASVLHKIAQALPTPPEPNNPLQMGGVPGNLPGLGPGMTPAMDISNNDPAASLDPGAAAENPSQVASPTALPTDPAASGMTQSSPTNNQTPGQNSPSAGMAEFLKGLEDGGNSFEDEDEDEDEERDMTVADLVLGLKIQAALVLEHLLDRGITRTAQIIPEATPAPEPNEVNEDVIQEPTPQNDPEVKSGTDFDKVIDSAFQQLTVSDVVSKLEDLTKVFKVREIPRQLAIVDMMLDKLGLASFFPELGECVQKSHDANNYVSSRLEDILSRLSGTLRTKNFDLMGENVSPVSQETRNTQSKLQQEQKADQNRKKMRRDLANQKIDQEGKPKPDLEVAEDLGAARPQMMPSPVAAPPAV